MAHELRTLLFALSLAVSACTDPPSAPEPTSEQPATEASEAHPDPPASAPAEEEVEIPSGGLEDLDRGALEAACFEGSQAACDRLGH